MKRIGSKWQPEVGDMVTDVHQGHSLGIVRADNGVFLRVEFLNPGKDGTTIVDVPKDEMTRERSQFLPGWLWKNKESNSPQMERESR